MSYTYLSTGPGSSERSWVRLTIGDNSSADVLLQDEEIDMLLADHGSKESAAAHAARGLAARYARKADKQVGKLRISLGTVSERFIMLAADLERQVGLAGGGAYAGGISDAGKQVETDDSDWAGASFSRGQFDNPRAG